MMKAATKGTLLGAAFGAAVWAGTGMWQFFAVALAGALCHWMFSSPSDRPQPRRRVREGMHVEIPVDVARRLANEQAAKMAQLEAKLGGEKPRHPLTGKRRPEEDATENGGYLRRSTDCAYSTRPHEPKCWCEFCVPPM